jgi:hypothetical protein
LADHKEVWKEIEQMERAGGGVSHNGAQKAEEQNRQEDYLGRLRISG